MEDGAEPGSHLKVLKLPSDLQDVGFQIYVNNDLLVLSSSLLSTF